MLVPKQPEQVLRNVKALLPRVPAVNRAIMGALFPLLACMAEHAEINKMPASNLAIVWAPNLLKNPDETLASAFEDIGVVNSLIAFLIDHHAALF